MDREQRVCPACGQPVQSVIRRHKTLGAWVPRWVAGPCHNARCEAYVEPGAHHDGSRTEVSEADASRTGAAGAAAAGAGAPETEEEPGAPAAPAS